MSEQDPCPNPFLELEWQRKPVAMARRNPMDCVADTWLSAQRARLPELIAGATDSPIEELFLGAWLALTPHARTEKPETVRKQGFPCRRVLYDPEREAHLMTQVEQVVSGRAIRLDFAIIHKKTKVTVECDGHQWHERSQEQAASDKSRDRLLLAAGWNVLRFTGSEIHADPIRCAQEALTILWGVAPKPVVAPKTKKGAGGRRPEPQPFRAPPRPKLTPEEEAKKQAEASKAAQAILDMLATLEPR